MRAMMVALALLMAAPASAQFRINLGGKKISNSGAKNKLRDLNRKLDGGISKANGRYGNNPQSELETLGKAEAILKEVEGEMGTTLRLAPTEYKNAEKKIEMLKTAIKVGHLMQQCSQARANVFNENKTGKIASDELLDAFDDAAQALKNGGGHQKNVSFWEKEAKEVRAKQPELAKQAAAKAQKDADRAQREKVKGASKGLETADKQILDIMLKNEAPVPAETITGYETAMKEVEAVAATATAYQKSQIRRIHIYNAFHAGDLPKVGELISAGKGQVVATGETTGKKLKLTVPVKKGHCYSVWTRWKTSTKNEKVKHKAWSAGKATSHMQRYSIRATAGSNIYFPWNEIEGVCGTKDFKATWTAELEYAGTRNGLNYVVVGWAKDQFPVEEAVDMSVHRGDICDPVSWKGLWNEPVPGSLVWSGGEAYLLTRPDRAGQTWVSAHTISGGETRAKKGDLTDEASKPVAFSSQFRTPKCYRDGATGKLSRKRAKCINGLDKKWSPKFEKAYKAKKRQVYYYKKRQWQVKIDRMKESKHKEFAKRCKPIKGKIDKEFEGTYNGLVDALTDAPPKNAIGRAARMAAEDNSR